MDPKLVFWTGAFVNMGLVVVLLLAGVRQRRRGDIVRHGRRMGLAAILVVLFLLAYALKLVFLGREALDTWTPGAVWMLRIHELCVAAMVLGGGLAAARALGLRRTRNATHDPADPFAPTGMATWHRRGGWTAVLGAVLGFLTAGFVLAGMYDRVGLP
jgi:uncharacterized membrane protein YozB (DUF420 family)